MISPDKNSIGFLGLGNLGAPMATRLLQEGWALTVHDVVEEKAAALEDKGATVASSLEDVLEADALVLVVPDDDAVTSVLSGEGGFLTRGGEGRAVIIHSTIMPATAQKLAAEAAQAGIALVDAPVSGGAARAADGDLTLFLGAEDEAAQQCEALLSSVASTIERLGGPGAGAAVKLANQLMLFATLAGAHEALELGAAYGVDEEAVLRAVGTSTGASWVTEHWGFFDETAHAYESGGTAVRDRPWSKDLMEILTAARSADLPVPVTAVLSQTLARYVEDHAQK